MSLYDELKAKWQNNSPSSFLVKYWEMPGYYDAQNEYSYYNGVVNRREPWSRERAQMLHQIDMENQRISQQDAALGRGPSPVQHNTMGQDRTNPMAREATSPTPQPQPSLGNANPAWQAILNNYMAQKVGELERSTQGNTNLEFYSRQDQRQEEFRNRRSQEVSDMERFMQERYKNSPYYNRTDWEDPNRPRSKSPLTSRFLTE